MTSFDTQGTRLPRRFRRRGLTASALLAVGALAISSGLVACGDDDDATDGDDTSTPTSQSTPTTPSEDDDTPTQTRTSSPGTSSTPGGGSGDDGDDVSIPDNAEDYAMAAFEAWEEGDMDTLETLVSDEALEVLEAQVADPTDNWSPVGCDAGAGSAFCTWESASGETLEMRLENQAASAAEPDAVVEVRFT